MLLKLLGWFWIIIGVILLIKPERFRNKLKKQGVKKLKQYFFILALTLGLLLIKATWGLGGLLAKIIMLAGFIALIKAFFLFKAKSADSAIEWYLNQPLKFFRMWAAIKIIFGAFILTV